MIWQINTVWKPELDDWTVGGENWFSQHCKKGIITCGRSWSATARFIGVQGDNTSFGDAEGRKALVATALRFLIILHIFSGLGEWAGFLSNYPTYPLGFPGLVLGSPLTNPFPRPSRAQAPLSTLILFPESPRLDSTVLCAILAPSPSPHVSWWKDLPLCHLDCAYFRFCLSIWFRLHMYLPPPAAFWLLLVMCPAEEFPIIVHSSCPGVDWHVPWGDWEVDPSSLQQGRCPGQEPSSPLECLKL